jgi:hypothetical protein
VQLEEAKKKLVEVRGEEVARAGKRKGVKMFENFTDEMLAVLKENTILKIKLKQEATESDCRANMFKLLELSSGKFRDKMVDYQKHKVSNVNIVNRMIRGRSKKHATH